MASVSTRVDAVVTMVGWSDIIGEPIEREWGRAQSIASVQERTIARFALPASFVRALLFAEPRL